MRNGAVVILQSRRGQYYLSERLATSAFNGMWGFPGGGIEAGESASVAAARELLEEAGIKVHPTELRYIADSTHSHDGEEFSVNWFYYKTRVRPLDKENKLGPWREVHFLDMPELSLTPGTYLMTEKVDRNLWE